jgi:c-di-GMP-binding flagellar brake protein YcgR
MEFEDRIASKKIRAILEQIKNDKSLIRMKLMEKDYEQLTVIDDIRYKGKALYLLIDCLNGFAGLIDDAFRKIECEFTGSDKLPYFFYADIAQVDQNHIWVLFPNIIKRRQLRGDFRVTVPSGTQVTFKKNGALIINEVINLSLGGSFGALISAQNLDHAVCPLCGGDTLTEVDLVFRSKLFEQRVSIRTALVVRFEENPLLRGYCCAIHFVDMDKAEEKALTELIYVIQRECRQKRLPIAD